MRSSYYQVILFFAIVFGGLGLPGLVRAADYTVCARLTTSFENVGGGEDYIVDADGPYAALYQRFLIQRAPTPGVPAFVLGGYLSDTGCVNFSAQAPNNYMIVFYSEVRVPRTDNAAQTNIGEITDATGTRAAWVFGHTFTTSAKTFDIPAGWATNLVVATRQSLFRFSNGLQGKTFQVRNQTCPSAGAMSCNSGTYASNTSTAYIHADHNPRKFAIAHELGHSAIAHYFGGNPWPEQAGITYDFNSPDADCAWVGAGAHMMHSMEYAAGALIEGFPQFYATYVFNSEASTAAHFYYYKDAGGVGDPVPPTGIDMEAGPTGGATAFMVNECSGVSFAGKGTELDWARQFWDYRTDAGTKPSNGAILYQLWTAFNNPATWETGINNPLVGDVDNTVNRMTFGVANYDAAFSTAFATRWDNTDHVNGINYPDP